MAAKKENKVDEEVKEEVVEDIEKKGKVSKKAAKEEEKIAEEAEKESTDAKTSSDIEEKKRKLMEKAKQLSGKIEIKSEELKEQVKGEKKTEMLVPLEEYINSGIYIGTKVITPDMRPFVYRRRADGLAIFNTDLIDEKLKEGIKYLSQFKPSDVILVCKRQAGWRAAEKFGEITGIRVFAKKYPAGVLTNSELADFFENELTIVSDAWVDKNALSDTMKVHKKVLMICDTNNFSKGADQIVIGNNKSSKSLGIIYYLLARGYCKAQGIEANIPDIEWWIGEQAGGSEAEAKRKARAGARFGV